MFKDKIKTVFTVGLAVLAAAGSGMAATPIHAETKSPNGGVTVNGNEQSGNDYKALVEAKASDTKVEGALFEFQATSELNFVQYAGIKKGQSYSYYRYVDGDWKKIGDVTADKDGVLTFDNLNDHEFILVIANSDGSKEPVPPTDDDTTAKVVPDLGSFTITKNVSGEEEKAEKDKYFYFDIRGYVLSKDKGVDGSKQFLTYGPSDTAISKFPVTVKAHETKTIDAKSYVQSATAAGKIPDGNYSYVFTVQERRFDADKDFYNYDYDLSTGYYVVYEESNDWKPVVYKTELTLQPGQDEEELHLRRLFPGEKLVDGTPEMDIKALYGAYQGETLGTKIDSTDLSFTNDYSAPDIQPLTVGLPIKNEIKTVDGQHKYGGDDPFTFEVRWADGSEKWDDTDAKNIKEIQEGNLYSSSDFSGSRTVNIPITFKDSGDYMFKVKEVDKNDGNFNYDHTEYAVHYVVKKRHNKLAVQNREITKYHGCPGAGDVGEFFNTEGVAYTTKGEERNDLACLAFEPKLDEIKFTNTSNKKADVMINKVDDEGNPVAGAKLVVYDKNGNKITEQTTQDTETTDVNKSEGVKVKIPTGSILISRDDLKIGETYTVKETEVPVGFEKANDVVFTYDGVTPLSINMVDPKVKNPGTVTVFKYADLKPGVKKGDATLLAGAELAVYDKDGKQIDKWTSDSKGGHVIPADRLVAGETYTVKELKAPAGFKIAKDQKFTFDGNGKATRIEIVDQWKPTVTVSKLDEKGSRLGGAKLKLVDETGKVVNTWTTNDKNDMLFNNLENGKKYTIVEDQPPKGYQKAKDITFTYDENGKDRVLKMVDPRVKESEDGKTAVPGSMLPFIGMSLMMVGVAAIVIGKHKVSE